MKKFRQWVPSQSGLNMKMAGKGVCIGARTCETKQRSTSTERLIKHLRVSRQLDEKGCDQNNSTVKQERPVTIADVATAATNYAAEMVSDSQTPDIGQVVTQLRSRLEETQSQLTLTEQKTAEALDNLYSIIDELKDENRKLREQATLTNISQPTNETFEGNASVMFRMETSLLKCDLAAAKSELLMCHKYIQKLEDQLKQFSPNQFDSLSIKEEESEEFKIREFGRDITHLLGLHENAPKKECPKPLSSNVTSCISSKYESSMSFSLSESEVFDRQQR